MGLGGSVVTNLINDLPELDGSHYHIVFDNLFTSPRLLRLLSDKGMAATGTLHLNRVEGAPLKSIDVMKKEARGPHDVVLERKAGICVVR
jgi:Transposase IS4